MLDILILCVLSLLMVLVAIKYGVLQVLAISLSLIALVPFGMSVYLYLAKRPVITYQLASKSKSKEETRFVYRATLGLHAAKGQVLLDGVYVVVPEMGLRTVAPKGGSFTGLLEETGFGMPLRLNSEPLPLFAKTGFGYQLHFESEEEHERLTLRLLVDMKIDPAKLGLLSIFQPAYTYRYFADIQADFTDPDRQQGQLASRY